MRDVAERACVSVTTVSHVVNETRPVSKELRQRVLTAMTDLGYQPNALARSLRRKQTHTIGLVIPDSVNPFFAEVARGIEDASFERDYSVILCNSDGDLAKELLYANVLAEKQVDGILFVAVSGMTLQHIQKLQARRLPLVVIDRDVPGATIDSVMVDNARGGWLATRHLIELGHRHIGCIAGPSDLTPSAERVRGYRQALAGSDIPVDETLIVKGDFHYEGGYQKTRQLLAMDSPPTAIFACNDLMAVGVISGAVELGRQVPEDLSVVGFDDIRLASFTTPPLTTVVQPKYEMGVLAVTMLVECLRDRNHQPRQRLLDTSLVIRQTTGPVPVSAETGR